MNDSKRIPTEKEIERLYSRTAWHMINGKMYLIHNGHRLTNGGHVHIRINQRLEYVHRVVFAYHKGYWPMQVNHIPECNISNCVDMEHLYDGTQKENVHDSINLETHRNVTSLNHGENHPMYGKHHRNDSLTLNSHNQPHRKITDDDAREIFHLYYEVDRWDNQYKIAEKFSVSQSKISAILNGKSHKHLELYSLYHRKAT